MAVSFHVPHAFRRWPAPFTVLSVAVVLFLAFLAVYPLSTLLSRLVITDGQFDISPFKAVWLLPGLGRILWNTAAVTVGAGLLAIVIGLVMAWLNERTDARSGIFSDVMPLMPFFLPPVAGAAGWVFLCAPRTGYLNVVSNSIAEYLGFDVAGSGGPFNIYSWAGMICVFALFAVPYIYMIVSAGLRNTDPALEEQARICGAKLPRTLLTVTLPAVLPSIVSGFLLVIWFGVSFISVPIVIGDRAGIEVLSVRIVRLLTFQYPPSTAEAIGLSLFVVMTVAPAWYLQQRMLRSGRHAMVGGKAQRASRIELGFWRWPARAFVMLYVLAAAVLPIIALFIVALSGYWRPSLSWSVLNLNSFRAVLFQDVLTAQALRNSISISIVAALLGVMAAAVVSLYVQRTKGRWSRIADGVIKIPAVFSPLVVSVGFILAFTGYPFNLQGTLLILVFAYFALYMPQAAVATDAAVGQLGTDLTEASVLSGAGGARTFWKIGVPIMLPGLVGGWTLLFVRMSGDLTASALLAGNQNPVVGLRVLGLFFEGNYAQLAALSIVVTGLSIVVISIMFWLSARWRRFESRSAK